MAEKTPPAGPDDTAGHEISEELTRCAMVTEHAVDHLLERGCSPVAVASALLGGSLSLLGRTMEREAILRILDSAAQSVRSGELEQREEAAASGKE